MKKFIIAFALLLFLNSSISADIVGGQDITLPFKLPLLTYVQDNTTGLYITTYVSTTTVNPTNAKILGFAVYPTSTSGEYVAAIHDATASVSVSDLTLIGELEAVPENFAGVWFPYPRRLTNGLTIRQGGQTRVIVYYTRY